VNGEVDHPDIRYVVYPVHRDGTPTGGSPRMRHDPDCGHFDWGDGEILGTPVLATEEQMRTLRACGTCAGRRSDTLRAIAPGRAEAKVGQLCQTCHQVMPLTAVCDNCE
jgi:hypothetical protein